ncbi:MAG: hypothetical protein D6733_00760 [Methanobacteriota archaeon]|nr:MAG: hypothetical protein D6733_00760 [Euryarchaeota archaeon]
MKALLLIPLLLILTAPLAYSLEQKVEVKIEGEINSTEMGAIDAFVARMGQSSHLKVEKKVKSEPEERGEKESKSERFHFHEISGLMLLLTMLSLALIGLRKKWRRPINMANNILLAALAVLSGGTGLLLILDAKRLFSVELKPWHVIISEFLVFIILLHLALHWKTYLSYLREMKRGRTKG